MAYLSDPKETAAVLNRYRFVFRKQYGQNFLIDSHVIDKILAAANLTADDVVLEIGPGIGTLTQVLCEHAGKVIAVEIDETLLPILREDTLSSYENVEILHADVRKLDLCALAAREGKRLKVVANLPYYITTPILMRLFEERVPMESATVMVQKEVATRIAAGPGNKDYGALSLAVQYYAKPYLAANVPPNCFLPRPNVGSAVLHLQCLETPAVEVRDEAQMFRLIRAAFGQRRKTLVNALRGAKELAITKEQAEAALTAIGCPIEIRGEALSLAQFARLSDALSQE